MRTIKNLFIATILLVFFQSSLSAQSVRLTKGLEGFSRTEFMVNYHDMKEQAEADMIAFIRNSHKYAPQDIARVRTAYNQTGLRFNRLMHEVKQDFLNRKKLKFIAAYPDTYSRGLEGKLRNASNFYATNLQQALADVTTQEQDGSVMLALIFQVVRYATQLVGHINHIQREASRYNDRYLEEAIVKPNRFASFDQLQRKVEQDPRYQQNNSYDQSPYQPVANNNYQNQADDIIGSKRTDLKKLERYFPQKNQN